MGLKIRRNLLMIVEDYFRDNEGARVIFLPFNTGMKILISFSGKN